MREQTWCFTGHRDLPHALLPQMKEDLDRAILHLLAQGVRFFGAGGALGFDTLAAQAVLRLRQSHPELRLILVLPCRTQADRWTARQKDTYASILARADKVIYTSDSYFAGCMHYRNRFLVEHSGHCICYYAYARGGTHYTVGLCQRAGIPIINLAPQPPSPLGTPE